MFFLINFRQELAFLQIKNFQQFKYSLFIIIKQFEDFKMEDFKIEDFKMDDFKMENFKIKNFKMEDFKINDFKTI